MKRTILAIALIAAFLAAPCPTPGPAAAFAQDEEADGAETVRAVLGDYAIAMAYFPSRKNMGAITRHLAEDYVKLNDGIDETAAETVALFKEIREQIELGGTAVVTAKIRNFYGEVRGETAWARYRFHFRALVDGELFTEEDKACSAVLEKSGETWLIRLEHCTSVFIDDLIN